MRRFIILIALAIYGTLGCRAQTLGQPVHWDSRSLFIGGHRVMPVMGEIHYSRLPETEWREELRKMKAGGVTLVANYVFWNHVEEEQGVFNWSGQRSLRHFLELCKEENLPVILRIGPFCHGEARNGGFPDWIVKTGIPLRSEDPRFLEQVSMFYRQIFTQVEGLQWKDQGPVIACQFDNEFRGPASYLLALKKIALEIGFDLPFYTRTGWPELKTPMPYGEMIPLYGDYADGFWDRSIEETTGNYWKAFNFKAFRSSTAIATEQIGNQQEQITKGDEAYPYFTCELGGGMMTSYHRRVYMYPEDAYGMALVKLGSGSNLLGYYMYHGGTNPKGETYLNECQRTPMTNYNDMPVKSYDFQAPLGEFGQTNPHYYSLRRLHLFMQDFGEMLAPMDAFFPQADRPQKKGIDSYLRWSYRGANDRGFVFFNNYERLQNLTDKKHVQFEVLGKKFPAKPITIPANAMGIFPFNIEVEGLTINYATAQLMAKREDDVYFVAIDGIQPEISLNGRIYKRLRPQTPNDKPFATVGGVRFRLLSPTAADRLFLPDETGEKSIPVPFIKTAESGPLRQITIGTAKVAEAPTDDDFNNAAVYTIELPNNPNGLLQIDYQGDCARLYADGELVADNFYNGRPFLYGLWRLPQPCQSLELRILPMQKEAPIYFPREADTTPGERVNRIQIIQR